MTNLKLLTKNSTSHLPIMMVLHSDGFKEDKSVFVDFSKIPPQVILNSVL